MKYIKLFESLKNKIKLIKFDSIDSLVMRDDDWIESTNTRDSYQDEYINGGNSYLLQAENEYSDTFIITGENIYTEVPFSITLDNLKDLSFNDCINLFCEVPIELKNFVEEHLIDLLDDDVSITFECTIKKGNLNDVSAHIEIFKKNGEKLKWSKVSDHLLMFHSILVDEYRLLYTYMDNTPLSNNGFSDYYNNRDFKMLTFTLKL